MTKSMKTGFYLILAIVFYYLCWGIPQFFNKYNLLSPILNNWFFSVVYTGIAGCLVPIILRSKYNFEYYLKTKTSSKLIGLLFLVLSLVFGLVFSEAIINTIRLGYSAFIVIKYILLFFPMALGLSLFSFLIIPRFIDSIMSNKPLNLILTSVITATFYFLGFYIDSTFGNIELALTMSFLGLFFGISNWFTKNFWITFTAFYITMLFNTLSEDKYSDYSFLIVLSSTAISLIIIITDILHNRRGQNNP
jgi:hypothetical protein